MNTEPTNRTEKDSNLKNQYEFNRIKTETNQENIHAERKKIISKEKPDKNKNSNSNNTTKIPKDNFQKDSFENNKAINIPKSNVNILNINNNYNYNFNSQTSTSPQNHTSYNSNKVGNLGNVKPKTELNKIFLPSNYNTTNKGSNSPEARKNIGTSPTTNLINKNNNTEKSQAGNINDNRKMPTGKGLNIIPLRNMNNLREHSPTYNSNNNNDRQLGDRISPKIRDMKIPNTNLSPKNIYMPSSTKNSTSEKIQFEMKFGNKLNMNNKSPSPKHMDFISRLNKKSPDSKK